MRAAAAAALIMAAAVAGCGGGSGGGKSDGAVSGEQAFKAVETQVAAGAKAAAQQAAPRWETVRSLSGSGDSSSSTSIAADALQWRARWSCTRGTFSLAANGHDFGTTGCPGHKTHTSIETGPIDLRVHASGPWRLSVDQQVNTALHEPPLSGMTTADQLATGAFYKIERRGTGTARLYRLPDGRLALRFEGFKTSANPQLFVWLSTADRPRTTTELLNAPHVQIALLKSTIGDQNYVLPPSVAQNQIRSVAVWCKPIQIAYTAAPLSG